MEELGTNGSPSSMKERVVEETERVGAGLILNDMEVRSIIDRAFTEALNYHLVLHDGANDLLVQVNVLS